jgi:hypothetical protein
MEKTEEIVSKESRLNAMKEEYNLIQSKKNFLKEHQEIIKELKNITLGYLLLSKIGWRLIR